MKATKYSQQVKVPKELTRQILSYLNPKRAFERHEATLSITAIFTNGCEMDVKCCPGDETPGSAWTEAVLFNKHGVELGCTEPCDEFFGLWEVEQEGTLYEVEVV